MEALSFTLLDFAPAGSYLDHDPEAPYPYAVWYPIIEDTSFGEPCDFDILGAGDTAEQAIEAARKQVQEWANQ